MIYYDLFNLLDLKNKYPEYPVYTEEVTPAPTWTMDISNLTVSFNDFSGI